MFICISPENPELIAPPAPALSGGPDLRLGIVSYCVDVSYIYIYICVYIYIV